MLKPDPAGYLLACDRLGVDPAGAMAVEDAPAGVRAAERRRVDPSDRRVRRRQRLAVAVRGDEGLALHWSVPEPPSADEEARWGQALDAMAPPEAAPAHSWRA